MIEDEFVPQGETGEDEVLDEGAEDEALDETLSGEDEPTADDLAEVAAEEEAAPEVETAFYRITGLVDAFDEQGNIVSQYPVGSKQELPVDRGTAAVEAGQAEAIGAEEE